MNNRLNSILKDIKALEERVTDEIQKRHEELDFVFERGRVRFSEVIQKKNQDYYQNLLSHIVNSNFRNWLAGPFILIMIIPAIILDILITLYHATCFRLYRIPLVKRSDYFIYDRHYLNYLNLFEKFYCLYCSYFNSLISYSLEVAARTEQFWCPIKHARHGNHRSSRLHNFFDYGDGESYRTEFEKIRRQFNDITP